MSDLQRNRSPWQKGSCTEKSGGCESRGRQHRKPEGAQSAPPKKKKLLQYTMRITARRVLQRSARREESRTGK